MRIIIFGCGNCGKKAKEILERDNEVVCFCDNDESMWGKTIRGLQVHAPEYLLEMDCVVVIAITSHYMKVNNQLRELGVKNVLLFQLYYDSFSLELKYKLIDPVKWNNGKKIVRKNRYEVREGKKNKRVLFISYYFPPMAGGGVIRALKFAKYLQDYGYEVVVLSTGYIDYFMYGLDQSLLDEVKGIDVRYIVNEPILYEMISGDEKKELRRMYCDLLGDRDLEIELDKLEKEGKKILLPDNEILWADYCLEYIRENIDVNDFDLIFTTSSPYASLFVGYYIKKESLIPWVADIRDPWCENDYINSTYSIANSGTLHIEKALEKELLNQCNAIIVVADRVADDLRKMGINQKIFCLTNGYDEEDFKHIKDTGFDKFTICYNGTIYGTRNPYVLLRVLNEMINCGDIDNDIQWIINGSLDNSTLQHFKEIDDFNILRFNGLISHEECLRMASSSHMLVSLGEYGEGAYLGWTGKIFEYFRTCVPILSFSDHFGVQYDSLKELNQGITVLPNETDMIKDFVWLLYSDWKSGVKQQWGDFEKCKKYERKRITEKLSRIFDGVVNNH